MQHTSTILIVDDDPISQKTLRALLSTQGNYELVLAGSGMEALELAVKLMPDLILLDVMMPGMDGFEVCRRLRDDPLLSEVPIIMITGLDDRESRLQGIEAGADDFIIKPFDPHELQARIRTTTRLNRYRHLMEERARFERVIELSPDGLMIVADTGVILLANPAMVRMLGTRDGATDLVGKPLAAFIARGHEENHETFLYHLLEDPTSVVRFETMMLGLDQRQFPVEITGGYILWNGIPAVQINVRDITARRQAEEEIERSRNELAMAYDATLVGWVKALDLRDRETEGHSQRVTEMTVRLARALGIQGEQLEHIRRGALLHDTGKMGIPDRILFKPGPLTPEEWNLMRLHPVYAYEWLSPIAYLRPSLDIPYAHHERWDGSGYPRGLKGKEIPLAARIFAVVDVWDALRSDRPYRSAWSESRVRQHLRELAGIHFDPEMVEVFLTLPTPEEPPSW
ncbi:MAG: response regulator [Chloroflexaceae bacterium]|nr:response regulator [Chloroflexaceae bacterium]